MIVEYSHGRIKWKNSWKNTPTKNSITSEGFSLVQYIQCFFPLSLKIMFLICVVLNALSYLQIATWVDFRKRVCSVNQSELKSLANKEIYSHKKSNQDGKQHLASGTTCFLAQSVVLSNQRAMTDQQQEACQPAMRPAITTAGRAGEGRKILYRQHFGYLVANFPTTTISKAGNLADISNPLILLCEQNPNMKGPPHTLHPQPIPAPLRRIFSSTPKIQQMPKKCEQCQHKYRLPLHHSSSNILKTNRGLPRR